MIDGTVDPLLPCWTMRGLGHAVARHSDTQREGWERQLMCVYGRTWRTGMGTLCGAAGRRG
jgi:hypothetical protein